MSKQSDAKERQQYTPKLIPCVCGNCAHLKLDVVTLWGHGEYTKEKNLRCAIGGFKVMKMGSCSEWSGNEDKQ